MVEHIEQFCDRYLVIERLGVGGFSQTFLARDLEMPGYPFCVVKRLMLSETNQTGNVSALRRQLIVQEGRILERFKQQSTANVPRLLACPQHHNPAYLVEEYIKGVLVEKLKHQAFNEAQIVLFLQNVLSVLDVIHQHNVVHLDIKPSNLIQRDNGAIAIIDFGAAIDLDEFIESDVLYGTPGYSPPEQQDGKIGFHTDLYALGMTAIELLTGIAPQQFERLTTGHLNWHSQIRDLSINPKVLAVVDRLVTSRPTARYAQAIDVLADLQQIKVRSRLSALPSHVRFSMPRSLRDFSTSLVSRLSRLQQLSQSDYPARPIVIPVIVTLSIACGFGFVPLLPRMTDSIAAQIGAMQNQPSLALTLAHDVETPNEIDQFLVADQLITVDRTRQIQVWDLNTAKVQHRWTTPDAVSLLATSRHRLVGQSRQGKLLIWELATGEQIQQIELPEPTDSASLSFDGQYLATVSTSRTLRIWQVETGRLIRTAAVPVTAVHYAPNNSLVCANDARIEIWDTNYTQVQQVFLGHTSPIHTISVSPDSKWLSSTGEDGTLVWRIDTAELLQVLPPTSETTKVTTAAVRTSYLITQHHDGAFRVWSPSGQLMKSLAYLSPKVAMSADARQVVSIDDKHLKIWQLSEAKS